MGRGGVGGEECEAWVCVVANWGFEFEMIALETLVEFLAAERVSVYFTLCWWEKICKRPSRAHRTFYPTTLCLHPRASKKLKHSP